MADINGTILSLDAPFSASRANAKNGFYQPVRNPAPVTVKVFRMRGVDSQTGDWIFWESPGKPSWNPFNHAVLNPTIVASHDVDSEA